MKHGRWFVLFALTSGPLACAPGYMKAEDLEAREQGPQHCASRCHELGMEMGALVLVSDALPGCVCQPRGTEPSGAQSGSAQSDSARSGASGATTGHAVLLAAAAAARQQQQAQAQTQPAVTRPTTP